MTTNQYLAKYGYNEKKLNQLIDLNVLRQQQEALNKRVREIYTISGIENYQPIFSHIQKGD
ncbi:hypothetical protein J7I93_01225 [Bacillus sp. ISL-47]|uniref:hypothetical protein n=1 Tax=Bacillus sp. ISL-47 TaxID=2819130 RepID=UPI001BE6C117|nr:hypothetical protein [Bacillus sp. ISL-47]MBT2686796.1 hypothetical protein [Bacillus sp. ISL-47]MBT2706851.1 hypothetical protein [Pseudomonas sp. ISL-84]